MFLSTGCKPISGDIILTEKDQVRCFQNPNFVYYDNGTYCRGNIEYDNTCAWRIQVCFDKSLVVTETEGRGGGFRESNLLE